MGLPHLGKDTDAEWSYRDGAWCICCTYKAKLEGCYCFLKQGCVGREEGRCTDCHCIVQRISKNPAEVAPFQFLQGCCLHMCTFVCPLIRHPPTNHCERRNIPKGETLRPYKLKRFASGLCPGWFTGNYSKSARGRTKVLRGAESRSGMQHCALGSRVYCSAAAVIRSARAAHCLAHLLRD